MHVMIVIDASIVTLQIMASLTIVIHHRNMFIVEAPDRKICHCKHLERANKTESFVGKGLIGLTGFPTDYLIRFTC
jgi:hypothetical protein